MGDSFKLYIIKCKNDIHIKEIQNLLEMNASSPNKLGPIKRDFIRDRKTRKYNRVNRFITLLKDDLFNSLINNLVDKNITISEYEIRDENLPPQDSTNHCFFPYSERNANQIFEKLTYISNMGIINSNDFFIHENGLIEFSNNVIDDIRTMIKIIIDTQECRVSWCRNKLFNRITLYF